MVQRIVRNGSFVSGSADNKIEFVIFNQNRPTSSLESARISHYRLIPFRF